MTFDEVMPRVNRWMDNPVIDEDSRQAIQSLLDNNEEKEIIDRFYKDLEFGTGGLRGIMGVGSNCINKYTLGIATQGLANYLKKSLPKKDIKVAIAYDSRNNSKYFATITAEIFSANGIEVYLFDELRPTPLLSFAIRYLECDSGVVITASHNPKEYNGYKAYWSDGAQLVPPHDNNVIEEVNQITDFNQIKFQAQPALIKSVGSEIDQAYYKEVLKVIPEQDKIRKQKSISLVYSSIHGAGITMIPECLKALGFENLHIVDEQAEPDGNFPTVDSPNPEEKSAMKMALEKAKSVNAELVMATDPDTDRVGIGIKDDKGDFFLLNGNQALSLMVWFILKNLDKKENTYIAKTIVTTELIDTIAEKEGVECYNTLTGFKYIAELLGSLEGQKTFIAAGEESYGYMVGAFVRDKDAVSACAFFSAMAAAAKDEGKTLYSWLLDIYSHYGFFLEKLINLVRKGADGAQQINAMMNAFRQNPPTSIGGSKTVRVLDYLTGNEKNLLSGESKPLTLPQSDVLQFYTQDGSKISVRPSGTEPKIKFYISVNCKLDNSANYQSTKATLEARIDKIKNDLKI